MAEGLPYDSGVILVAALPDDDPNDTGPAAARIITPAAGGGFDVKRSGGVQFALEFDPASPNATVTVTPWVRDHNTGTWHSRTAITTVGNNERRDDATGNAQVFLQLTALTAFNSVRIRGGPIQ